MASGRPLNPEIANDVRLRQDLPYDESRDIKQEEDLDDEYSDLAGVVGTLSCHGQTAGARH